jgi:hypothetical protein
MMLFIAIHVEDLLIYILIICKVFEGLAKDLAKLLEKNQRIKTASLQ